MIIHVVGQDDAETDSWALERHDLAAGVVAISVPSGSPSMSSVAYEIAEGLGLEMDSNPHGRPEIELLELVRALIRGHGVRELILVHADWLPLALLDDLARWITLLGLEAYFITHPPVGATGWLEGWTSLEIGWSDFVARWVRGDRLRSSMAADPGRHQAVPLPSMTIGDDSEPMSVPVRLEDPAALAGYAQLAAALGGGEDSVAMISGAIRSVLRHCETVDELDLVLPGVARALDQAGLALRMRTVRQQERGSRTNAQPPTWADLRRSGNPAAAAAIALLGADLRLHDVCAVRITDIAADGTWVAQATSFRSLASAARPFVVANRLLRIEAGAGPEDPFIASHGRLVGPVALARMVTSTFADLGVKIDTDELRRPVKPNERWLRERGLIVTGIRSADRCRRHGLPATVKVAGASLSHSRRACAVVEAIDMRTATGSVVNLVEDQAAGSLFEVQRYDRPAGHLWLMHTLEGPAWLDIGSDATPSIDEVAAAIERNHPKCVLVGALGAPKLEPLGPEPH